MTKKIILDGSVRSDLGSSASEKARREGLIPCVIYNNPESNEYISINRKDFTTEYTKGRIKVRPIEVNIGKKKYNLLAVKIDKHPVTKDIIHIDFMQITPGKEMKVSVAVEYVDLDKSLGIKRGAYLNKVKRSIYVLCTPENIPECIHVSVEGMFADESVKIEDVKLPEGVRLANNRTKIVCNLLGKASAKRNYVPVKEEVVDKKKKKK